MKRVVRFLRRYKLFGLACYSLLAGLALQALHQTIVAHWLLAVVSILATLPLLWHVVQEIRAGKYGVDILALTAIVGSVILGQYWTAIVLVLMVTLGESVKDFASHQAQSELTSLKAARPQKATVVRKNKPLEVLVSELKIGDKILIKTGEVVPVDAVITEGIAQIDESSLTGESYIQEKAVGDWLASGSLNKDGDVTAKVIASAADSQYQQVISWLAAAGRTQAPLARLTERFVLPFTFTAFSIAAAVWLVSGQAIRALEVIIVATPGPLLLVAPIALLGGLTRASRYGLVFKTGSALENLADAETIAFNKTGTLTGGHLIVNDVLIFGSTSTAEVIKLAGSLEQNATHLVGQAIIAHAKQNNIKLAKAKHVREVPARGLQATIQGKTVVVGRLSLLEENGVVLPKAFKPTSIKQTAVYIALGGELVGAITFRDAVRDEAAATIKRLHSLGLRENLLLTGDSRSAAEVVAKQLSISQVHAESLPADTLRLLDAIKKRPLVFVSNSVNDAAILTAADVGITLGASGLSAASEAADVVILPNDFGRVATAYALARRTFKITRQSILIGISLSLILMLVFATGKFPSLAGAILQEVIDVLAVFSALRAHRIPRASS